MTVQLAALHDSVRGTNSAIRGAAPSQPQLRVNQTKRASWDRRP